MLIKKHKSNTEEAAGLLNFVADGPSNGFAVSKFSEKNGLMLLSYESTVNNSLSTHPCWLLVLSRGIPKVARIN